MQWVWEGEGEKLGGCKCPPYAPPMHLWLWSVLFNSVCVCDADLRPVILDTMDTRQQESSDSASSWSLSALDEAASRVHLSSLDFGGSPRLSRGGGAGGGATGGSGGGSMGGSRARLHISLMHESSIEQESSQLSQDSSNGSISQPDEEDPSLSLASDSSLRYSRTGLDSPTTASTPLGGGGAGGGVVMVVAPAATPSSLSSLSVRRGGLGTSVIVGGRTEDSPALVADDEGSMSGGGGGEEGGSGLLLLALSPGRGEGSTEQATSQGAVPHYM